ncbi:CHAT domain-containing protein [Actinosynnema sp. NPDC047251]
MFAEPWAHDAQGYELRGRAASPRDTYDYQSALVDLAVWRYKDALRARDRAGADAARADLRRIGARLRAEGGDWWLSQARARVVVLALENDDPDAAADEVLAFHADVRTTSRGDLEDNQRLTDARVFVDACLTFLVDPRSVGHRREGDVVDAMVPVHEVLRASWCSVPALEDKRHEALRMRAALHGAARPASPEWTPPGDVPPVSEGESPAGVQARMAAAAAVVADAKAGKSPEHLVRVLDDMAALVSEGYGQHTVALAAGVLADAALTVAEIHDDPAPLFAAADRLSDSPSLAHLLRARAHIVAGDISSAASEVEAGLSASDGARPGLLPHLYAMLGWTIAQRVPEQLDAAIAACRTVRDRGRADITPADLPLARLLVEKALNRTTPAGEAMSLLREALTLCGRPGTDNQAVAQEAKDALAVLTGRGDVDERLHAWRSAVRSTGNAPATTQMRLATAWVRWALGTNRIEPVAEAYHHLVSLIPVAVRVRYRTDAQARVLAAVREHTEEAGYWLARAHRYRDAVVALETGRAVALSALIERDDPVVAQALCEADRADLLDRYRDALAGVDACEHGHGDSHSAWALVMAVAREIADVIGADPVAPAVEYADIAGATDDGAVVYVAAADASGYALVVAGRQDPQCVWLPDLNRGVVEEWLEDQSGTPDERAQLMKGDLDRLWTGGMRDLLAYYARGPIVTLVPVGVMTSVPLHATPSRAGQFSALRYAPNARTLRWCEVRARAFAGHPARVLVADVPQAAGEEQPLGQAAAEAAAVEAVWSDQCTRLPSATWARFEPIAHAYDVWHIACHGHVEPRAVLNSALGFTDTWVTIRDLRDRFHSEPRRLAIVSACDMLNVGEDMPNESIGLPSALLQLGFAGVIAASWKVGDLASAYLMARFHHEWRSGGAHPAVALTVAQRWLQGATIEDLAAFAPSLPLPDARYGRPRPFAHPWHWAAFAYTGG